MFQDSSNVIKEYTTSVTGFINNCINDVVPIVTVDTYPNQKLWIAGNICTELKGRAAALKAAALPFSSVRMLPVIHGFWLGYECTVTVGTTLSMHLLMKPVTDAMYSSMPSEESWNIFQSVLAKQSCSLASASSDYFFYWPSHWCFLLSFLLVSRNQEDRIMVRFAKRRARESFVHISVCGVKVI